MESSKRYVLQKRWHDWDPWERVPGEYSSIEEAKVAKAKMAFPSLYRVAEAYTVTRYKAVRE